MALEQLVHDGTGNLVLNGKNILQFAIEAIRPDRKVIRHPDQLGIDTELVAGAQDRAFQHERHSELSTHLMYVARLVFKEERGCS